MIEKVARAIFDVAPFRDSCGPYEEQSEVYRRLCETYARAAIEAMLALTEVMGEAGFAALSDCIIDTSYGPGVTAKAPEKVFRAMITAALEPRDEK